MDERVTVQEAQQQQMQAPDAHPPAQPPAAFGQLDQQTQAAMDMMWQHFSHITTGQSAALEKLRQDNSVNIIGNPTNRASIMSFTIKGIHPPDMPTILDDDGVAIRAGHHCCQILHDKLGIPATARASIGVYNSKEDMDVLCESIKKCKKVFQI